jgi:hypothetical protein
MKINGMSEDGFLPSSHMDVINCFFRYFLQVMMYEDFNEIKDIFSANRSRVDIVTILKSYYQREWFMNQTAVWNSRYIPSFTENPTRRGFGSTFNMLAVSDLFTNE